MYSTEEFGELLLLALLRVQDHEGEVLVHLALAGSGRVEGLLRGEIRLLFVFDIFLLYMHSFMH